MKSPKIYIIGSGAIGKALAVFLQQESKRVTLVRGSVDNQPASENLITVTNQDGQEFQQNIPTTTFSNVSDMDGIVLVATKTFANTGIAKRLKEIKGDFSIVLLQNGLNIERPFDCFDKVYRCVLFSTSQLVGNNNVVFKTVTASPVGNMQGINHNLNKIINQINTPYFSFRSEPNILKYVWNKVIINCAFNSICPLLEVDNGIFHRNFKAAQLARKVIKECVELALKYDVELDMHEIEEKLMLISTRSDGQLISTYEDIRKKRRTEIESLNLEISRLADKKGIPELVPNTKLLGEMIRIKSETAKIQKAEC